MMPAYLVIGPGRTGTSLAMGLMKRMGVHVGPSREGPSNEEYNEHPLLWDYLHDTRMGAKKVVEGVRDGRDKWAMKHPKIAEWWPRFSPYIDDPRFIVTHRDILPTIASSKKAIRQATEEYWVRRLRDYYRKVEEVVTETGAPVLYLQFEWWFNERREDQLACLSQFIDEPINQETRNFIDPSKRHYQ